MDVARQDDSIVVMEDPQESQLPSPASPLEDAANHEAPASASRGTLAADSRSRHGGEPGLDGADLPSAPHPEPASSAPWSMQAGPMNLDVGGYWKNVVVATDARPGSSATATRILREGLADRDRDLGLAPSGALLSAAHEATSPNLAPDVGSATLEIDTDATGKVVGARVLSAAPDTLSWERVAREVVRLMAPKTLRVPAGARGLRSQVRIVAERRLPSGSKSVTTPGAIPDDVAGSPDAPMCDGSGPTRRCKGGMPLGFTKNATDVTNAGARTSRVVAVQLLSELAL